MEHPHHDDSHLPDAIENSDDNIEKLCTRMVNSMSAEDWREYALDALEKEFEKDAMAFRDSWNLYMVNQ